MTISEESTYTGVPLISEKLVTVEAAATAVEWDGGEGVDDDVGGGAVEVELVFEFDGEGDEDDDVVSTSAVCSDVGEEGLLGDGEEGNGDDGDGELGDGEDGEDGETALLELESFVSGLDAGQKRKAPDEDDVHDGADIKRTRKRRLLPERTEAGIENEFAPALGAYIYLLLFFLSDRQK